MTLKEDSEALSREVSDAQDRVEDYEQQADTDATLIDEVGLPSNHSLSHTRAQTKMTGSSRRKRSKHTNKLKKAFWLCTWDRRKWFWNRFLLLGNKLMVNIQKQ